MNMKILKSIATGEFYEIDECKHEIMTYMGKDTMLCCDCDLQYHTPFPPGAILQCCRYVWKAEENEAHECD